MPREADKRAPLTRERKGEVVCLRARFSPIWRDTEAATIAVRAVVALMVRGPI
ncbi:MAG: hypothetical protein JO069_16355 [Verrucomicrobia bacterium]|nr:hypothetical protein [Verrucomicrobiota bacterium]